jgi:8-hydroxy-5-deazaflavin:NADPH oxidoreductase
MKIGVIGSGEVGRALAKGFLKYGYEVMIGSNNAAKRGELASQVGDKVKTGSFEETTRFGELIVLAVKGGAAKEALASAGVANLKGKTILDTTNPIDEKPPVNGVLSFFTSLDDSLMERLQKQMPDAHFVKAFNSIGSNLMVSPDFGGARPTMFICGNDEAAKKQASGIVQQFGFDAEDMGRAESARALEPLCMLWCLPGFLKNQWTHAFKLLKK